MKMLRLVAPGVFALNLFAHQPVAAAQSSLLQGQARHGKVGIPNGAVALYTYGTTGYGSLGQLLAQTSTDRNGSFTIDTAGVVCPAANTPVYLALVAQGASSGEEPEFIEFAGGLTCGALRGTAVVVNEITTAAMAYAMRYLSGYDFSAAQSQTNYVVFGSTAGSAGERAMAGANRTVATLVNVGTGTANTSSAAVTTEAAKLLTVANIAAACTDLTGPTAASCSRYLGGASAAWYTAYFLPQLRQSASDLFQLQPAGDATAFPGGLTAAPHDWTLGIAYRSPQFGLGLAPGHLSTVDIDLLGRVWFPSNAPGAAGVGYFDPVSASFSPMFAGTGMQHPDQVAIDANGTVWVSDAGSAYVNGFPSLAPQGPVALSIPGTVSTALAVDADNTVVVGIVETATQEPLLARVTGSTSYAALENTRVAHSAGFIAASLAGDSLGPEYTSSRNVGTGVSGANPEVPTTFDLYYGRYNPGQWDYDSNVLQFVLSDIGTNGGQVIWTGTDYVAVRSGSATTADGICFFRIRSCYPMADQAARHVLGMAEASRGAVWVTDSNTASVESLSFLGVLNGYDPEFRNPTTPLQNTIYPHGSQNGGTMVAPTGIAIDRAGNVWVSNFGCSGASCTPGSFVLSELVGVAMPTTTPVSGQITGMAAQTRVPALAGALPGARK